MRKLIQVFTLLILSFAVNAAPVGKWTLNEAESSPELLVFEFGLSTGKGDIALVCDTDTRELRLLIVDKEEEILERQIKGFSAYADGARLSEEVLVNPTDFDFNKFVMFFEHNVYFDIDFVDDGPSMTNLGSYSDGASEQLLKFYQYCANSRYVQ